MSVDHRQNKKKYILFDFFNKDGTTYYQCAHCGLKSPCFYKYKQSKCEKDIAI